MKKTLKNKITQSFLKNEATCDNEVERQWPPHSSTLAWRIPWTEEPGALQSMGSQIVGHD